MEELKTPPWSIVIGLGKMDGVLFAETKKEVTTSTTLEPPMGAEYIRFNP